MAPKKRRPTPYGRLSKKGRNCAFLGPGNALEDQVFCTTPRVRSVCEPNNVTAGDSCLTSEEQKGRKAVEGEIIADEREAFMEAEDDVMDIGDRELDGGLEKDTDAAQESWPEAIVSGSLMNSEIMEGSPRMMMKLSSGLDWENLTGLLLNTGTGKHRLTESQFTMFQTFLHWMGRSNSIPSTRTVRRTLRPWAREHLFAKSVLSKVLVDFRKAGARGGVDAHFSRSEAPILMVNPSSWAMMDVGHRYMKSLIDGSCGLSEEHERAFSSFEELPLVRFRELHLSPYRLPDKRNNMRSVRKDDTIRMFLASNEENLEKLRRWNLKVTQSGEMDSICIEGLVDECRITTPPYIINSNTKRNASKEHIFNPGDINISMRGYGKQKEITTRICLVFRAFVKPGRSTNRMFVVLCNEELLDNAAFIEERPAVSIGVSSSIVIPSKNKKRKNRPCEPMQGKLRNGDPYIVYRVILYSDGFSAQFSESGSNGGVYMMPCGIPPNMRTVIGGVRKLCLTPPGVSANDVFLKMIPDIVKGAKEGFTVLDDTGSPVRVFIDVVAVIQDYPEQTSCMDTLGHTANVPCNHCMFERYDPTGRGRASYGYTTLNSSDHMSFCRHLSRTNALRRTEPDQLRPQDLTKKLGMKNSDAKLEDRYAFFRLARELDDARESVPVTSNGRRVVPCIFDPYRSCIVAPDHVFFGLTSNVIEGALKVSTRNQRQLAEVFIVDTLKRYRLSNQRRVFNIGNATMLSMSMSASNCVLLVAPWAFEQAFHMRDEGDSSIQNSIISLLSSFQNLVRKTQFDPIMRIDGKEAIEYYNRKQGYARIRSLKRAGLEHVRQTADICMKSEELKKCLDKPNLHRLVELYSHTLPCFGNITHIQELVLEKCHQEMKTGIADSNHKNAQLQAMEHALANDWAYRLSVEAHEHLEGGKLSKEAAVSVRRLLGAKDWNKTPCDAVEDAVEDALPPPVSYILQHKMDSSGVTREDYKAWFPGKKLSDDMSHPLSGLFRKREKLFLARRLERGDEVSLEALRSIIFGVSRSKKYGTYETIIEVGEGDMVQIINLPENEVMTVGSVPRSEIGGREFWMIRACFKIVKNCSGENDNYRCVCISQKCNIDKESYVEKTEDTALISMVSTVRPVMLLHDCGEELKNGCKRLCIANLQTNELVHSISAMDGGKYVLMGHEEGYPPRRG